MFMIKEWIKHLLETAVGITYLLRFFYSFLTLGGFPIFLSVGGWEHLGHSSYPLLPFSYLRLWACCLCRFASAKQLWSRQQCRGLSSDACSGVVQYPGVAAALAFGLFWLSARESVTPKQIQKRAEDRTTKSQIEIHETLKKQDIHIKTAPHSPSYSA